MFGRQQSWQLWRDIVAHAFAYTKEPQIKPPRNHQVTTNDPPVKHSGTTKEPTWSKASHVRSHIRSRSSERMTANRTRHYGNGIGWLQPATVTWSGSISRKRRRQQRRCSAWSLGYRVSWTVYTSEPMVLLLSLFSLRFLEFLMIFLLFVPFPWIASHGSLESHTICCF